MVSSVRQILGLALATIGFLGSIIICALPMWISITELDDAEVTWLGLWKFCVSQSMVQMECMHYDSEDLLQELQAAKALIIIAIIIFFFGFVLGVVGGKFTTFIEGQRRKCKVNIAAGIIFIIAGLMVLISVCWVTKTINQNSNDPELKIEYGASLYIGWFTAGLLFLGGGLLCSSYQPRDETNHSVRYRADP